MKKTGPFASSALALLVCVPAASALGSSAEFPSHGDASVNVHPKFHAHLKCPYADRWLAKGPEQAAKELGLDAQGRKLRKLQETQGSCNFDNAWGGGTMCMEFRGLAWTGPDMSARCDQEKGAWTAGGCVEEAGGWCNKDVSKDKTESTAMALSAMADCDGIKMACASFMGGTFIAAGRCASGSTAAGSMSEETGEWAGASSGGPPPEVLGGSSAGGPPPGVVVDGSTGEGDPNKCLLAPGAIGAAHQAGFSKGYSSSCPGTPAQESPYMWPLAWSADVEQHNMAYGSDDVVYRSRGRTFYMLDRNWKRSDSTYAEGVLRTIGQGPCENPDEDFEFMGCRTNQTDGTMTTMIHRENLMYFISWKDDADVEVGELDATKIEDCTMMNLAVIGNIRPDWYMDKRGDDTDVQYLGDQHVYYADGAIPKLVKQWRKKDFASQYFVMSMMGNPPNYLKKDVDAPVEDNIHWPLILNVPGEGFGDDHLSVYRNHELLDESDEDLFLLIENYQAIGGECVSPGAGMGEGGVGPPVLDEDEAIPSNLEVDPLSWVSNEITFSPIWIAPVREEAPVQAQAGKTVLEVSDSVTVESCYDASTSSMDMSVYFHGVEPVDGTLPWMALGYRPTERCEMTPREGGSTPIVLVTHEDGDVPEARRTELLPGAKAYSADAFATILASGTPLGDVGAYNDVSLETPMLDNVVQMARSSSPLALEDTVSLHFKQAVEGKPAVMNLMYAVGVTSQLGSHATRGCFQLEDITPCKNAEVEAGDSIVKDGATAPTKSPASKQYEFAGFWVIALATLAVFGV